MKKIIIKKNEKKFSYIKYFLFTFFKKYKIYDKFFDNEIFNLPFKKRLSDAYLRALKDYLKEKEITHFLSFDKEINKAFKNTFSGINGKNIYYAKFINILEFLTKNNLCEYELIFISDNIKEIKEMIEKSVKKVKGVSVLTEKPFLYDSMQDFVLSKYGALLNIKTKKEKLKKHNKLYINCGSNRVFEKHLFKNVNMLDIYNVYDEAYTTIILEAKAKEKEYIKRLGCCYSLPLAEYLYNEEELKEVKIVSVKK